MPLLLAFDDDLIGFAFIVIVFGGGIVVALSAIVLQHRRRSKLGAYNARLKQMMIERGMSPEEITRVIESGDEDENRRRRRYSEYDL